MKYKKILIFAFCIVTYDAQAAQRKKRGLMELAENAGPDMTAHSRTLIWALVMLNNHHQQPGGLFESFSLDFITKSCLL